jgi:hypothetical protein
VKEINGNIWDYYDGKFAWIIVPINNVIKKDGTLTMGRGVALHAKTIRPYLPYELAVLIKREGYSSKLVLGSNMIAFPTKYHWHDPSSLVLIEKSAIETRKLILDYKAILEKFHKEPVSGIYSPRVGCGNGQLDWSIVKPIIEKYLGDLITIVNLEE